MKNSVLDRLKSYFDEYFSDATRTTARNLFLIVVSILALDIFRSVRKMGSYFYCLKTDTVEIPFGIW